MHYIKKKQLTYEFIRFLDGLSILLRFSSRKKIFNLLRCYWKYFISEDKLTSYPIEVKIDPTNICNLNCPYCQTGAEEHGREMGSFDFNLFKEVLDNLGEYLYLLSLFGHGEPFLCKNLLPMVKYAWNKNVPTLVHTNFNIDISEDYAHDIVNSSLAYLSISIDGGTQQAYQQYRVGGNLKLVLKNIDTINRQKKRLNSRKPVIIWQYLLFKHNEDELRHAACIAKEKGVRFRVLFPKALEKDISRFHTKELSHREGRKCKFPWTTINFASDGAVVPCCVAYYKKDDFGRTDFKDFFKLWNNDNFLRARRFFKEKHDLREEDKNILCYWCPEDFFWKDIKK